jgi:hypothetical protein
MDYSWAIIQAQGAFRLAPGERKHQPIIGAGTANATEIETYEEASR